ncbi:thiopeptide-type bacteriocin biosynthesis protein [Streptacidiphilus sp. N1-12]|uniref:Thiopeptide-type bacteriocin biosynthesis protein n=2 Tax=Streptacidiphilus alkalitolerans TaxID=3342712 RepID=A0ABV6V3D1_9ACTN
MTDDALGFHSLHLFLHCDTEQTDAFLTEDLAPLLEDAEWFFIRYGEDGPQLRVRVRGLSPGAAAELPVALARLAKERPAGNGPWPSEHAEVRAVPYVPETERYGGPRALPVAEEVFVVSSRVAVQALRQIGERTSRLTIAADACHATAFALGLEPLAAAQWLRRHASGWRWITDVSLLPGELVHAKVNSVYAAQHRALVDRARALWAGLEQRTAAPWLNDWAEQVRAADQKLRGTVSEAGLLWVWGSQLHMLLNRLGVTPDEERAVCRLVARTLLDAGEPPSFFPTGHRAPDRQYLERSKFQIGRPEDSALRPLPPSPDSGSGDSSQAPAEIDLPAEPLPEVSLRAALTARTSARGPLGGPLTAGQLGTLLWGSHAESHRTERQTADGGRHLLSHRPYPSAGALYTVRLRLIALDVAGLPAGTYQCVPLRRTLSPVGPAPSVEEIKPLSSYFTRASDDPDGIGVDRVPALLGLYLDLGLLRRRYGLRALRLGLLEAGHLAQTLLLTAAALGLATTPLGGFHDDLAHELFGLDDLDQPLQYLLPLGRLVQL